MTIKATLFILTMFSLVNCFGQTNNNKKQIPDSYSNWMSIDYINCLKTDLPCECEKPSEYFLISWNTTKNIVLFYEGESNYEYNLHDIKTITPNNWDVYNKLAGQVIFGDTTTSIGQIKIKNDTLLFTELLGKQTKFIHYSTGDYNAYLKEYIKLLDAALSTRGYENLNTILQSDDNLKCWCNWELGGLNSIYGKDRGWILEKQANELLIYEWTNRPTEKIIDYEIEKKILKKLKW